MRALLRCIVVISLTACRVPNVDLIPVSQPNALEQRLIQTAITDSFFMAVTRFDYAALRRSVTPNFELVEDTLRLTMDGFVDLLRSFEGQAVVAYRFDGFNTRMAGGSAWTTYRNIGEVSRQGRKTEYVWLETAVLVRSAGAWRIDRLQSTVMRPR